MKTKKLKKVVDTGGKFAYNKQALGPVAQLVRALACHARGRGFEPHPGRQLFLSEKKGRKV